MPVDKSDSGAAAEEESTGCSTLERKLEDYERWFRTLDDHVRLLEAERQKLSAIVNGTDAGFIFFDAEDRVNWTNAYFHHHFGIPGPLKNEPLGLRCHQALCRKSAKCGECPLKTLHRTEKVAHHELNLLAGDCFRQVYATAIPVRTIEGKLQAVVMLQDVSRLKILRRSEEALRSTEERFRSVFAQAGAGMVTLRADGSFLQVNQTFCRMLGYTESEMIRKRLIDVTHAGDAATVRDLLREVQPGHRRAVESELRYVRRDGSAVWCSNTAVWQFEDDRPTHAVALIQDISERKRAELALEQSQKQYEALVHSIDGIVWEADPRAFRFSFVSKQARRILGFPRERWLSQPRFWRNQIHPQDLERVVNTLVRAVQDKRSSEHEYRMISADGRSVWLRDAVSPVVENNRVTKLRGLMVDITERKAAECKLRNSEEQLRQSQKMEAIGRLAGGIAHDFNNLLTAITGYGDFLLKKLGSDHPLRREAEEISKAALRAADLTGQLLAFSRQQVLQPKVLDLKGVVRDMELMLRRVIGEHIELVTRLDSQRGAVKADPGQMHQVLLNLAVNGRDAMQAGGQLGIEITDVTFGEDDAGRNPGVPPGNYVKLSVQDTGCGIDPEILTRLFEPFFTTKEQGKGTGLGLSTVYGIVTQSGGHIEVDSTPGLGTTFRIYLPMVEESVPRSPARPEALPEMSPGTESVLLVEDDESVRDLAREILEMNGYTVFEAGNGVEALEVFEQRKDEIHLMVTDLVMPRLGGRELGRKVGAIAPELPVLYLSGYTDSAILHQGELRKGSFFLQKPFTPAALAVKVREALDD